MTTNPATDLDLFADMPEGDDKTPAPYVKVVRDKATGRVVIALNADAADTLTTYLDGVDLQDLRYDGGQCSQEDADAEADLIGMLYGTLRRTIRTV
jgi:hypothetical protein